MARKFSGRTGASGTRALLGRPHIGRHTEGLGDELSRLALREALLRGHQGGDVTAAFPRGEVRPDPGVGVEAEGSAGVAVQVPGHQFLAPQPMNGDTQIIVSGREYKVPGNVVTYEQVVKIWNELHEAENKHIIGTPGIDYEDSLKGEDGVLLPGKDVEVKDGTSFSVDPEHVS